MNVLEKESEDSKNKKNEANIEWVRAIWIQPEFRNFIDSIL